MPVDKWKDKTRLMVAWEYAHMLMDAPATVWAYILDMHTVYTSMHLCINIHPYTCAYLCIHMRMYSPGRAWGRGAKMSPPIAPLSSLYRWGAAYPIPLVFLTFRFITHF